VRKKTPLTLQHLRTSCGFCRHSRHGLSWIVDMDERKRIAAEEARPLKEQSPPAKGREAARWNEG